jgi:flagellar basal body-associated protein FliL
MNEKEKGKEKEKAPEAGGEKKTGPGAGPSKILFPAIIAGTIIFNIIMALVLIQMTKPKGAGEKDAEAKADSLHQQESRHSEMGEIGDPVDAIVNVSGTDGERLLKIVVRLEFPVGAGEEFAKEMKKQSPRVRSLLIGIVSDMTLAELNEPAAKDKILKNLLSKIHAAMPKMKVSDVLLDQFIIQ